MHFIFRKFFRLNNFSYLSLKEFDSQKYLIITEKKNFGYIIHKFNPNLQYIIKKSKRYNKILNRQNLLVEYVEGENKIQQMSDLGV